MAKYAYTVTIAGASLLNVQNLTVNVGRAGVQDPFRTGTAVISGRNLTGFLNPTIGQRVIINANGSKIYDGRVADVSINYGIVASMDTWEIRCEDALADAGRSAVSVNWAYGETAYYAAYTTATLASINVVGIAPYPASSKVSAQSGSDLNLLQVLQTLVQTEQGRLFGYGVNTIAWLGRKDMNTTQTLASFTDGSLTATYGAAKYDGVQFRSLADNYATKVVVQPSGLAAQTSGSGYRTFTMDSYDWTTAQAADLAGYVRNTLTVAAGVPSSMTCLAEEQTTNNALDCVLFQNQGSQCEVILRGVRYRCIIEGTTVTATPESSRFTYYLSSSEAYQFLVLNDSVYGKLGTGKLGF